MIIAAMGAANTRATTKYESDEHNRTAEKMAKSIINIEISNKYNLFICPPKIYQS